MGTGPRGLAGEQLASAREATAALRSIESILLRLAGGPRPMPAIQPSRPATALAWAGRVVTAAGVVVAIALAAILVAPRVLPVEILVVLSGSMEPAVPVGSLVLLERIDAAAVRTGDVITFARPDRADELVTHRVVGERTAADGTRELVTKGDANAVPDPWLVPATGVGWRVAAAAPLAGYVLEALRSGAARAMLFVIPLLALAAIALRAIWRDPRRA